MGRPPSSVVTLFKHLLFSETTGPIKVKLHMELLWDGGTIFIHICLTKMAAMHIHGKNLKNLLLQSQKADDFETWYAALGSNHDHRLSLTDFTARKNLVPYALVWEKVKTIDVSETIVVYDIKVGRCCQFNEYMKLYACLPLGHLYLTYSTLLLCIQFSRSIIDLGRSQADSVCPNFFSSITAMPIEEKFDMMPPWGTKSCSNGPG